MPGYFNIEAKSSNNKPMLAGVCSRLAGILGWNVWAIRAVFLVLLVAKTLWAVIFYAAVALLFGLWDRGGKVINAGEPAGDKRPDELRSPELAARKQRIDDLEQRFRDWEQNLPPK